MTVIKALSLDGGGIRGIIPAMVLAKIEELAGEPIHRLFDLVAGNSTGGILALGLTKPNPLTADEMVELYVKNGADIFKRSIFRLDGWLDEKYSSGSIEKILEASFRNNELREALVEVVVLSYDIENRIPHFFKSRKAKFARDSNFYLRDVARATSAAPSYFEPARVRPAHDGARVQYALVDDGVVANNPALCVYTEARNSPSFASSDDILLVSIGTGKHKRAIPYRDARQWGKGQWATRIIDVVFDGTNSATETFIELLLPPVNGERRYFRFQASLDLASDDFDDTSEKNIQNLINEAEFLIQSQLLHIQELVALLKKYKTVRPAS